MRKCRSVHLRGHDPFDGEEAGPSLRISKQFLHALRSIALRRTRRGPRMSVSYNTRCFRILTFQAILDTVDTYKQQRSLEAYGRLISVSAMSVWTLLRVTFFY